MPGPTRTLATGRSVASGRVKANSRSLAARSNNNPTAPIGLASTGGPVFTWNAPVGATSYNLYRRVHGVGGYVAIQTGIALLTASDGTILLSTSYDFYVTAVNGSGESVASNVVTTAAISLTALWLGTSGYTDSGATTPCVNLDLVYTCKDTQASYNLSQSTSNQRPRYDGTKGLIVCETESPAGPEFEVANVPFNPKNVSIFFIVEQCTTRRQPISGDNLRYYAVGAGWNLATSSGTDFSYPVGGYGRLAVQESGGYKPGSDNIPTSRALLGFVGTGSAGSLVVNEAATAITVSLLTSTPIASILGLTGGLFPSMAGMKAAFVADHSLTSDELSFVRGYANACGCPFDTSLRIIYAGDSITQGISAPLNNGWARQLGYSSTYVEFNVSQGGITMQTMAGDVASSIVPLIKASRNHLVFLFAGTNDAALAGRTAAQIFADTKTWCNAVKAAGTVTIVILGMLPRDSIETVRQSLRTLLLADFTTSTSVTFTKGAGGGITYADYYLDIASDTVMGANGDNHDLTYYEATFVHPNITGHTYLATTYIKPIAVLCGA